MFGYQNITNTLNRNSKLIILTKKHRHFWKNMDSIDLNPPASVRGMINLDRNAFTKIVKVPKLHVPESNFNNAFPLLKKYLLKMERFKPVRLMPDNYDNKRQPAKRILLHPLAVKSWNCLPIEELQTLGIHENNLIYDDVELSYDNWRADEILKFVLPLEQESVTSFSRIGHIVHVNLRDHLLQYKQLIGDVLKDKVVGCRTVVNKSTTINNTYRNFEMELICGEPDYKVEVKENGNIFEFDFSKVYWNPRLSTEHERIVKLLNPSDILYDVFAGVGPFSVPAAKRKCIVLANDLNPDSFNWLKQNLKRIKCTDDNIQTFNKDGRDFILNDLREHLLSIWTNKTNDSPKIHITMNLPGMAVEFLDAFNGLFGNRTDLDNINNYPLVHVYSFAKGDNTIKIVQELVEKNLNAKLTTNLDGIYFVRNVAPNKDMYRVSFYLTKDILFGNNKKKRPISDSIDDDCINKKNCC